MLASVVLLVLSLDVQSTDTAQPFKDLSGRTMACDSGSMSGSGQDGNSGQRRSPLTVTVRRLDKREYRWREPVVIDVEVRNSGSVDHYIPWATDTAYCDETTEDGAPVVKLLIGGSLVDPSTQARIGGLLGGAMLAGSLAHEASMLRLAPGGVAIVRWTGRWAMLRPHTAMPDVAAVSAEVTIERRAVAEDITASNSIVVHTLK